MASPTYRPGDLVHVGTPSTGGAFYAEVRKTHRDGLTRGRLEVRGLHGSRLQREVLTRDVRQHWRKVR